MLRSAALLTVFGFAAACVDPTLVPFDGGVDDVDVDAGTLTDAGPSAPDAGGDAGPVDRDAGQPDDGGVDAGFGPFPTDGGPPPLVCIFPVTPIEPFACEGDEDFCDVEGDISLPNADILAVWSHMEGDEFVIDVRFAGMPFREPMRFIFLAGTNPFPGVGSVPGAVLGSPYVPPVLSIELQLVVGSDTLGFPLGYSHFPLDLSFDICTVVQLHPFAPLLQFRFPALEEIHYFLVSRQAVADAERDYPLATNEAALLSSNGGRPDGDDDLYESVCNISCESIGGTTQ